MWGWFRMLSFSLKHGQVFACRSVDCFQLSPIVQLLSWSGEAFPIASHSSSLLVPKKTLLKVLCALEGITCFQKAPVLGDISIRGLLSKRNRLEG